MSPCADPCLTSFSSRRRPACSLVHAGSRLFNLVRGRPSPAQPCPARHLLLDLVRAGRRLLNSFVVKAVNIQPLAQRKIGAPAARAARALEVAGSNPGVSVTSFLNFYCFRARFARKCERSDPRVDFYSTPSRITIVKSLNRDSASSPLV